MLKELIDVLGEDRQAATCRELTKKFEEFKRGTLGQLRDYFAENEPRGEFVVVVSGCGEDFVEKEQEAVLTPVEYVKKLVDEGNTKKEAMKIVAKKLNMSRRDVYQAVLADEK